jgi:hypothetical protein
MFLFEQPSPRVDYSSYANASREDFDYREFIARSGGPARNHPLSAGSDPLWFKQKHPLWFRMFRMNSNARLLCLNCDLCATVIITTNRAPVGPLRVLKPAVSG